MSCESNTGEPITYFFYESDETDRQLKIAAAQANHYTKRHAEWRLLSGGSITVDYTVTPFGNHDGLIIEIQPIDRLLRISREEMLTTSHETTRNLVRGMAHEIKNPLGGIRGAAQLLARELPNSGLTEYTISSLMKPTACAIWLTVCSPQPIAQVAVAQYPRGH